MREGIWAEFKLQLLYMCWDVLPPLVGLVIMTLGGWYVLQGDLTVGEVVAMSCDLVTLSVELGAGIDAVSEDIPGRKFTTSLVGRLPVL